MRGRDTAIIPQMVYRIRQKSINIPGMLDIARQSIETSSPTRVCFYQMYPNIIQTPFALLS